MKNYFNKGKLATRSLSDPEALLQALNNTAIVSETDAKGYITFVNDKFVEISKYSKEELIGQNHRILKSGFHPQAFYKNLWATISHGRLWRGQIKNKAKDGSYYWVDTSIAPILNDGKPIKYVSVRFPITERQLAEEKLRERAKQQSILTTLSQEALANQSLVGLFDKAVVLLSKTLGVECCLVLKLLPDGKNLTYESGVGFKNAVRGKTLVSAAAEESLWALTFTSKEPVVIEDLSRRFATPPFLQNSGVLSGISVVIRGQDRPFGILEAHTRKKRIFTPENINFVQAVANLLANAARNQLDKRKDEFFGVASHELKTPLTSIKTFIQILQKKAKKQKDEESLPLLSKVDGQVNNLTGLINELLDISRINSGKLELHYEKFELSDLIEEIVSEHQLLTKKHKIAIEKSKQKVYGDKLRISQVLANLITNAIKYSPDSEKIIVKTDLSSHKAIISVRDFGIGIQKNDQPYIFDRFYQGDSHKRESFPGGLGLGLYICSEIIKRHGGEIWVESKEGKGSTFLFTLPIKR